MKTPDPTAPPRAMYGLLQPGEQTTRRFSKPCPGGYMPILQARGGVVYIVDQSAEDIILANKSSSAQPYAVFFATVKFMEIAFKAKSLASSLYKQFGPKKGKEKQS